jgi:hypothetical protein
MGCHIDGFIAVVAHTHVITNGPVTGRAGDVLAAANTAAEVAMRLVRPGKKVSVFAKPKVLFHKLYFINHCSLILKHISLKDVSSGDLTKYFLSHFLHVLICSFRWYLYIYIYIFRIRMLLKQFRKLLLLMIAKLWKVFLAIN